MKKKMFLAGALVALMAVGAFAQTESDWITEPGANGLTIILYKGKGGAVTVPARIGNGEVGVIGPNPFINSMPVTSLTIPASVVNLWENAFFGLADSLTSITFQGTMVAGGIHDRAFWGLGDLRAKYLAGGAGTYTRSGSGNTSVWTKQGAAASQGDPESDFQVQKRTNGTTIMKYVGNRTAVNIPAMIQGSPVDSINDVAFEGAAITSVIIPNSVIYIRVSAFADCDSLTSITISNSVTLIDSRAFAGCTALASVTFQGKIPESGIHANAFYNLGDLRAKYLAGGAGTYTRSGSGRTAVWTKK
jgi:hypothetical protein